MILEAIGASILVAIVSLVGVLFFGNSKYLVNSQRYVVPIAVGVFLSLVLFELIPETLELSPTYGGIAVALGFIAFYVLSALLHKKYHSLEEEDCDRKGAAMLLLIGDAIHNMADGVILGGAFLIDPAIGFATAVGLALHEIPQEIVEFGVLIRAGHTKLKAALLNLLSASSIVLGTLLIMIIAEHADEYIWLFTGIAAGNLLFLAASDLLPRIHGNLKEYGTVWRSAMLITLGFVVMTSVLVWTHEQFGHVYEHDEQSESHEDIGII
ncbi:MAG: ZIP family metal transporter [Parcubacteria group bacterium]